MRIVVLAITLALAAPAASSPGESGLRGVVTRESTSPVCRVEEPCEAPAAGVALVFKRAGHVVARTTTGRKGGYRIGLKPVLRRVWAPRGQRPIARGHHRYEWFYVTAFVSPATGESFWYLSTGVDKELFADTLALFAREAGAGRDRIIILVLDGAGWHTEPLAVPEGIRLVHLPPYTPELQPAETLWAHVDEPIVNKHFNTLADLDAAVAEQCVALNADRERVRGQAGFHWWPARVAPN